MLFPDVPQDLAQLSDEDLANLLAELAAAFEEATAEDVALDGDTLAQLSTVTDNAERIRAEQDSRAQAAANQRDQIAELQGRINASVGGDTESGEEPETEGGDAAETEGDGEQTAPEGEGNEPPAPPAEPETEPETQNPAGAASTAPAGRPRRAVTASSHRTPSRLRPRQEDGVRPSIVAAADIPGVRAGQEIRNLRQVADLLVERQRTLGKGNGDHVSVVQFQRNLPRERHIDRGGVINDAVERFNTEPDAIRAAGGLCAPVNNYYEQEVIATTARPVRDALANFTADRGGIRFNPSPTMADVTSGTGVVTAEDDVLPADDEDFVPKSSFVVTCKASEEVDLAAIYTQLTFGNFGARAWPEAVDAWQRTALAKGARTAETVLLDRISTESTAVTATGPTGAGREVFARLGQAAAGYRSFERMDPAERMTVLLPAWTLALISADFARTFTDNAGFISLTDAEITALFGQKNLDVAWYLDSKTGGGQVWDPDNGGALRGFPGTVDSFLFPTGAFLHLDGGTLDLGLVRDSTLNSRNQFTTFVETFEEVAHVGHRSLEIVLTTAPTGEYAAAVDTTP